MTNEELVAEIKQLRVALFGVAHSLSSRTGWCWCSYTRMVHDNDGEAPLPRRDRHLKECWKAREATHGDLKP